MKETCSSISELLEKYFDREVTEKERRQVENHLQDCRRACRNALKSMEEIKTFISAPVEEAVPEEDFSRVWQNIQREIRLQEKPSWQDWLFHFLFPLQKKVWIPAAATALVLLFLSVQIFFRTPSQSSPSVVEYVESKTHNVMVYEAEKSNMTVIWLFEEPEQNSPVS